METKSIVLGIALLATTTVNAQNLTLKANNIDKIVAAMTLEEKAHLLVGNHDCTFNGFESRRKQLKNDVQPERLQPFRVWASRTPFSPTVLPECASTRDATATRTPISLRHSP